FDLLEFFSVRVYSSDTIYRKPDKRIFQVALKGLEVSASEAVMVGDKVDMDIRGGSRAGLNVIYKRGVVNRKKRVGGNITVIESIGDLPRVLGDGFGGSTIKS
ncbi:MAG: HAD-IA family hydrolase, partial [Planctomycetes bacterium]|nr:HAD-IA family hydrolase [Planctomycetota bacterium]